MARVFNLSVLFKVVDKASGPLLQVGQKIDGLKQPLGRVQYSLKALARDPSWANIKIAAGRVGTAISAMAAKAGAKIAVLSSKMSKWAMGMMRRFALPMLAGGGLIAVISRTAGAYDESMRMIRVRTKATDEQMKALADTIRETSEGSVFSIKDLAAASFDLLVKGTELPAVMRSLGPATILAAAANTDLAAAMDMVDVLFDQMRMKPEEVAGAMDTLAVAIDELGADGLPALTAMLDKGGSQARQSGLDFKEIVAIYVQMSKSGASSAKQAKGLAKALADLEKPTKAQSKVLFALGLHHDKTKHGFELLMDVARQAITRGLDWGQLAEVSPILADILLALGENEEAVEELRKAFDESGSATDRAEEKMKGLNGALANLKKSWADLATQVFGTDVTLTSVIDKLSELMNKLTDYTKKNPELMQSIIKLAGLATLLLPVLWVVGTIGRGLNTLGGALRWVLAFFGVGIGKSTKFALTMRGLWKWIGLLIWRFRALGSAIGILLLPFILNWESTKEMLRTIWNDIVAIFTAGVAKCLRVLDKLTFGRLGLDELANEMENLGARLAPIRIPKVETRVGSVPAEQMAGRMMEQQRMQSDINLKITTPPGVKAMVESKRDRGQGYGNLTVTTGPAYLGAVP